MVFSRTSRPVAGRPTARMVSQVAPLLLLVLSLCVACASAASWAAAGANCTAVPLSSFGAPSPDLKTMATVVSSLDAGATPASSLCPGLQYSVKLKFPEKRVFIASASQGTFAGGTTACPNRVVGTVGSSSVVLPLTLPCGASGTAKLMFASVAAANKTAASVYKQLNVSLPVAALSVCAASLCAGTSAPSAASSGLGATGTTGTAPSPPAASATGASAAANNTVLVDLSNRSSLLALLSPAAAATSGAQAADPLSALRGALATFASSVPPLGGLPGAAASATPLSGLVSAVKTIGSVVNQGASSAPSSGGGLLGLSQLVGAVQQIGSVLTKNATSSATTGATADGSGGGSGGGGILGLLDSPQTIESALSGGSSSAGSGSVAVSKVLSALESVGSLFSPSGGTAATLQGLLDTGQGVVSALSDLLPMGANGMPALNMQGLVPFVQAVGSFFKQLGGLGVSA